MSDASPLFDTLPVPQGGCLILSAQPASLGSASEALQAYRQAGAGLLVSLLPEHELLALGLGFLAEDCARHDLPWAHCPIDDFSAPDEAFEARWLAVAATVHGLLDQGRAVVLHCRAGLGRTGTIAARILIERGMQVEPAIELVRQVRRGAIETERQEAYLRSSVLPRWPVHGTPADGAGSSQA